MSKQRAKGTAAEKSVVEYLTDYGFKGIERRALGGTQDRGDIAGLPQTVVEVKDCGTLKLSEWLGELDVEMRNANANLGVVWAKRRGKGSPADWYCVMPGRLFAEILDRLYGNYLRGELYGHADNYGLKQCPECLEWGRDDELVEHIKSKHRSTA